MAGCVLDCIHIYGDVYIFFIFFFSPAKENKRFTRQRSAAFVAVIGWWGSFSLFCLLHGRCERGESTSIKPSDTNNQAAPFLPASLHFFYIFLGRLTCVGCARCDRRVRYLCVTPIEPPR